MSDTLLKAMLQGDVVATAACVQANPALTKAMLLPPPGHMPLPPMSPLQLTCQGPAHGLPLGGQAARLARRLLQLGAAVEGIGSPESAPLISACRLGAVDVARVLLEAGADIASQEPHEGLTLGTPLEYASHFGAVGCVDLLMAHGAQILDLGTAAAVGLPEWMRPWLPGASHSTRCGALRIAAVCGRVAALQVLLDTGMDVDTPLADGGTALHWAAWEGRPRMVAHLLSIGANVDAQDHMHHATPRAWAAVRHQTEGSHMGHGEVLALLS